MIVRFKKIRENAVIPTKAHPTDAGFDLVATEITEDRMHDCLVCHLGIAVEIPKGYVGLIFPRSSIYRYDLSMANAVGVIDSGYRGEVMAIFRHCTSHDYIYQAGERVAQLIIVPYPEIKFEEVSELSDSDRGVGGHGSTGR